MLFPYIWNHLSSKCLYTQTIYDNTQRQFTFPSTQSAKYSRVRLNGKSDKEGEPYYSYTKFKINKTESKAKYSR